MTEHRCTKVLPRLWAQDHLIYMYGRDGRVGDGNNPNLSPCRSQYVSEWVGVMCAADPTAAGTITTLTALGLIIISSRPSDSPPPSPPALCALCNMYGGGE